MTRNILVTGGAGFVGSHLVERLVAEGHQVTVVDNLITGRRENLASLLERGEVAFVKADVAEPLDLPGPFDEIYHLASPASPPDYLRFPFQTMRTGAQGTLNVLDVARRDGARFLLASTSEVYGDPQCSPQPETYWGNVNPVGPRAVYDEAKRFAEAATMAAHHQWGLDTRIARIFNTYGPRMRPDDGRVVSNFIVQALQGRPLTVYGDGRQTRSFCYVDDLVAGLVTLMAKGGAEPVNLGNPVERTILDLAATVQRLVDPQATLRFQPLPEDDPKRRRPDIRRATQRLGWTPTIDLEDGLERTIAHFRAQLQHVTVQEVTS